MDVDNYQTQAARTLIDEPDTTFTNDEMAIMIGALELGAAVGKVLEMVKKGICHRHGLNTYDLFARLIEVQMAANGMMNMGHTDRRTYHLSGNDQMLIWCALGLGGEAGEVMDSISKLPDGPYDSMALVKELGDNDWYNAAICTLIGVLMSDVMQANNDKLKLRFPEGWGSEASKARVDTL